MVDTYKYWQRKLEQEKKAHKTFREQAEKAEKAARDDDTVSQEFNIHWANCKITRSAIFASKPKPDVRRRYQKPDPEEKELARMVERAIEYQIDSTDFDSPSQAVVKDYVESGLGIPRIVYDVTTTEEALDEEGNPLEKITAQSVGVEHIPWRHFHWEPGRASWGAVNWIAFESFKPRKEVEEEYGVKVKAGKDDDAYRDDNEGREDEVQLYEIWHRPSRKVYVMAHGHPKLLEEREDQLQLQGFFPIPRPMFGNLKSDEIIPKPDYCFIESQVVELNRVTQRIKSIAKQVKAVGYYDSSIKGMERLKGAADGTLQPVDGLGFTEDRQKAVQYLPFAEMVATMRELEGQRDSIKDTIYEVVGIADIVRGASKASETAAAQSIKGQWANVRLNEKTSEVARVWRDVYRIFAEIICEHFTPEMLMLQTGVNITPRMYQMMKSDVGRSFAIDIETDSTIAKDSHDERQQVMEMVNVILEKMEQVIPAVQNGLLPVSFVQETLLLLLNKYKHAKQLEDAVNDLGPHLQGLQQFQQKMQGMAQELQKRDAMLQQQGQKMQQMGKQLAQFNAREEARKDAETRAKVTKEMTDARAQEVENRVVEAEFAEKMAKVRNLDADTEQTATETAMMGLV